MNIKTISYIFITRKTNNQTAYHLHQKVATKLKHTTRRNPPTHEQDNS